MAWSEDDIATLTRMWNEGKTASEIAAHLVADHSRSAIIGKAHRLDLNSRPNPVGEGPLPSGVARKLYMRIQKLGLPSTGREAVLEAFAFTETGTPAQIARALGMPLAKVEQALAYAIERLGPQAR